MAFILSAMLQACKIKPDPEPQITAIPSTAPATMTKGAGDGEAEALIAQVLDLHQELDAHRHDFTPCDNINNLFGKLVGICTRTIAEAVTDQVLSDPNITAILPSLHDLCSTAECCLESYWANRISGNGSSTSEKVQGSLREFPYYTNYVDLTRVELSALTSLSSTSTPIPRKFAFIGSGPLPLTSLCICDSDILRPKPLQPEDQSLVEVLNIDINQEAISQSQNLCKLLGPGADGMKFLCSAADDTNLDLSSFDVVYLAALVGSTQAAKEALLESVVGRMRKGALLVIRSAERLRRLMYAEFDPTSEKVLKCLDICLAVHPYNHIVNSVIIGQVKGKFVVENSH